VTDEELIATLPVGKDVKYGGRWWRCAAMMSFGAKHDWLRERQYLLTRDGDTARVPADCITKVRESKK